VGAGDDSCAAVLLGDVIEGPAMPGHRCTFQSGVGYVAIVEAAHAICPYSTATRGNVPVTVDATVA
jgi:hypothetical protein